MESKMTKIYARSDKKIQLKVYAGHFATPQSHITHYLDLTTMRSRSSEAMRIAEALAANYETSIPVDHLYERTGSCRSLSGRNAYQSRCLFHEFSSDYLYHFTGIQ